jgi:hypothetical protein
MEQAMGIEPTLAEPIPYPILQFVVDRAVFLKTVR